MTLHITESLEVKLNNDSGLRFFLPAYSERSICSFKNWSQQLKAEFFSLPFSSLSKCLSFPPIIKIKLPCQGKKASKHPHLFITPTLCPGSRCCSTIALHPSHPFLVAALCLWIWSLNSIMEITDHFVCVNPLGLVNPSQHPTGRRNEQRRKKPESLYFLPSLWKYYRCITLQAKPKCPRSPLTLPGASIQ